MGRTCSDNQTSVGKEPAVSREPQAQDSFLSRGKNKWLFVFFVSLNQKMFRLIFKLKANRDIL